MTFEEVCEYLKTEKSVYVLIPEENNLYWRNLLNYKIKHFSINKESINIRDSEQMLVGELIAGKVIPFRYVFKTKQEMYDFFIKEVATAFNLNQ